MHTEEQYKLIFREPTFRTYLDRYANKMGIEIPTDFIGSLEKGALKLGPLLAALELYGSQPLSEIAARNLLGVGSRTFAGLAGRLLGSAWIISCAWYGGVLLGCLLCAMLDYLEYQSGRQRYLPAPRPRRLMMHEIQQILTQSGLLAEVSPTQVIKKLYETDVDNFIRTGALPPSTSGASHAFV